MNDAPHYDNCVFYSLEAGTRSHKTSTTLDQLNEDVTRHFMGKFSLSSFYLYAQNKDHYVASALFRTERDINSCKRAGILDRLTEYVHARLADAKLGEPGQVILSFHFESMENLDSQARPVKIPTKEDFVRADKLDQERSRGLAEVSNGVKRYMMGICPLYDVYTLAQRDVTYRVFVFFNKEEDMWKCKNNGAIRELIEFVHDELARATRQRRGEFTVAFEFDSDENVRANYEGDYFLRLK